MTRKHCAFCDRAGPLTKEHLWPKSLHKRLEDASSGNRNYFWLNRLKQVIASEPQVRDVCANCNNGVLSELDSYICDLFDAQLIHMPKQHETVTFSFDYHLLKRWLLKLSFNSARIHDSPDRQALQVLRPYHHGSNLLGRSTQLFLQLVHPKRFQRVIWRRSITARKRLFWSQMATERATCSSAHMESARNSCVQCTCVHIRFLLRTGNQMLDAQSKTSLNVFLALSKGLRPSYDHPNNQSKSSVMEWVLGSLCESPRSTEIVFNGDV